MQRAERHLPVPPVVVGQVVKAAADPDAGVAQLAQIIERDPALSSHLLRAANSPFYAPRTAISTVARAAAFMGVRTVRNLVLCFGVRELSTNREGRRGKLDFPLDRFWEASLRRAAVGKCLAKWTGAPHVDELFTLGLCQDVGVLIRLAERPELGPELTQLLEQPAPVRLQLEQELAGEGHDELGGAAFEKWSFPEELAVPVRFHHRPAAAPEAHRRRAQIALAAEAVADLVDVQDKQRAMSAAEEQLRGLGLSGDRLGPLVDEMNRLVAEAAEMLQLKVGQQPSYQEIAASAAVGLLEMNLSYQDLNAALKKALAEQQRLATELRDANSELEKMAACDGLTGLPNRRSFDDALERALAFANRSGKPLTLLLLDIDHFKRVNDVHGHLAGDLVLKEVAGRVAATIRRSDLAARYGGEEFAVILPATDVAGGRVVAERVRASVAELAIQWEQKVLRVSVSIGGAQVKQPGAPRAGVAVIREADDALYAAKESGRNRVCWAG
jgi:diguanylate cyclase (GGDEF)-like protein